MTQKELDEIENHRKVWHYTRGNGYPEEFTIARNKEELIEKLGFTPYKAYWRRWASDKENF